MISDTASVGAAAWNDKGNGNEIVFDFSAAESETDREYWERTRRHEETHQEDQADKYNLSTISYGNKTISVNPVLSEWQACKANKPSDLTAKYKQHVAEGNELVEYLGSEGPLVEALKTGDMASLQQQIDQKEIQKLRDTLQLTA